MPFLRVLTDASLKGLKSALTGKRPEVCEERFGGPGNFGVRGDRSGWSFFFYTPRLNGAPRTRWTIARVGQMPLADARAKAREWAEAFAQGIDPREEERRAALERTGRMTVNVAAQAYFKNAITKHRTRKDTEREIRNEILARWGDWALEDMKRKDVVKMMEEIAGRGAQRQAHNIYGQARTFFRGVLRPPALNTRLALASSPGAWLESCGCDAGFWMTMNSPPYGRLRTRPHIQLGPTSSCCC